MKTIAVVALTFIWSCAARGLKTSKVPEESPMLKQLNSKLEAENDALRQRNKKLKAMMQVARSEVHRMDAAIRSGKHNHNIAGSDSKDIESLEKKLASTQAAKKALAKTLRQMLAKNSTKIFQNQAVRFNKERAALQAQVQEANGKLDEAKEMTQTLQEQNMDLQKTLHELREKLSQCEQKEKEFDGDKANLVTTMHGLMRENNKFKKDLNTEMQKEKKDLKEIAMDEAKIANLTKQHTKVQPPAAPKKLRSVAVKDVPMHLEHKESMAAKIAGLKDINRYIDRADVPSDDPSDAELEDALQKQDIDKFIESKPDNTVVSKPQEVEKVAAMTHTQGLSNWLGLKVAPARPLVEKDANGLSPIDALDPEAVKQEKATEVQQEKADEDDGGDGIQGLLAQAKDQLDAVDAAEAGSS